MRFRRTRPDRKIEGNRNESLPEGGDPNFTLSPFRVLVFALCALAVVVSFCTFLKIFIGPMLLAVFLAYLSNPLITRMTHFGLMRVTIVSTALFLSTTAGVLAAWFLLPLIYAQFEVFFTILPETLTMARENWLPKIQKSLSLYFGKSTDHFEVASLSDFFPAGMLKPGEFVWTGLGAGTQVLVSLALFLFATPVFCFFLMKDYPKIVDFLKGLVPLDLRRTVFHFASDVDYTLRSVLSGQIFVVCVLSVLYSATFYMVGLPGGLAVGLIAGIARIVPYLDLIIGGSLSFLILVTNASSIDVILGVVFGFLAIQLLDGLFLTPRIVGQFSGLHPVVIIIAVLAFADTFGFYGVLLAIPSTAVGRVFLSNMIRTYKNSQFYLAKNK